jgi:hypothetical protein
MLFRNGGKSQTTEWFNFNSRSLIVLWQWLNVDSG